ncbi:TetR/AcrR family transcriptional regulator [Spirochaeta cellobiosiphila]|uniref:TetR/AcrR family transcriptional regulator n=1 Tax=Spirochaeta cellobiosiphila TaxID=504483 RepID=UPI00041689E8|nr:TetR/AcrR family transcriptional regulator [Spirochaeta cellobiosiphila]
MDNRDKIKQVATKLFSRRSYENVGIQQIVDECGISKPTLYYYFSSKKGLMEAILKEEFTPFLEGLADITQYAGDVMGTLRATVLSYQNFSTNDPYLYYLYKSMSAMPEQSDSYLLVKSFSDRESDIARQLFADIAKDHGNIGNRSVIYGSTFLGMVETYIKLIHSSFEYTEEDLLYRVLHQFLHGIYS